MFVKRREMRFFFSALTVSKFGGLLSFVWEQFEEWRGDMDTIIPCKGERVIFLLKVCVCSGWFWRELWTVNKMMPQKPTYLDDDQPADHFKAQLSFCEALGLSWHDNLRPWFIKQHYSAMEKTCPFPVQRYFRKQSHNIFSFSFLTGEKMDFGSLSSL